MREGVLSVSATRTDLRVTVQEQKLRGPHRIDWSTVAERGVFITLGGCTLVWLHGHAIARDIDGLQPAAHGMYGASAAFHRMCARMASVAPLPAPVHIRGESGVGKELVARALHSLSRRSDRPWVVVNLAAVPVSTAASALFGHRRGAFTGADQTRIGYFAQADGGTLFLDEVGETASDIQPQLLRALENKEIQPVGGSATTVDVRVIAATDADLAQLVADGRFRRALLHRLQAMVIDVPPLRARPADIPILLHHFLRAHLREHGADDLLFAHADGREGREWLRLSLVARLMRYDFPGNVRELRHVAGRIALDGHKRARAEFPEDLVPALEGHAAGDAHRSDASLEAPGIDGEISEEKIVATLREHRFNISRSARALGISRNTMIARIREMPGLRLACDLTREEIVEAGARVGPNIDRQADELQVSAHGLRMRMRELGLR